MADGSTATRVEHTTDATRQQASEVTSTAKEQVRDVASQAAEQARSTLHKVQDEVRARADEEAQKFAQTLHDASRQMQTMAQSANGDQNLAASLVREGAGAAERLASRLEGGGVEAMFSQVRTWARRNPGGFLLGATVAGFVAGRVVRNLNDEGTSTSSTSSSMSTPTPLAAPPTAAPLARAAMYGESEYSDAGVLP